MHNILYVDAIKIIKYLKCSEDPSSGRLVQCLAENYKNDSIVSVDMNKVVVMGVNSDPLCMCLVHCIGISSHNTDHVHVNEHDKPILLIFSQALYKAP